MESKMENYAKHGFAKKISACFDSQSGAFKSVYHNIGYFCDYSSKQDEPIGKDNSVNQDDDTVCFTVETGNDNCVNSMTPVLFDRETVDYMYSLNEASKLNPDQGW